MLSYLWSFLKILCLCSVLIFFTPAQACEISGGHTELHPARWYKIQDAPFAIKTENDYLWAYMSISGEDHVLPAWSTGGASFEFIIPADYINPWQDKQVDSFWLTDGEQGCEITGLTHKAMMRSPSGLAVFAMNIVIEYQALAAEVGYPISEIKAIVEDQKKPPKNEPVLQVIYGAMGFFGDYVRFSRDADADTKQVLDVMDAYLAAAQGAEAQNDRSEINQALYDWHTQQHSNAKTMQYYPMNTSTWGKLPKLFADEITRVPESDFTHPKTAKQLSLQMQKQHWASIRNDPSVGTARDVAGTMLGLGSTLGNQAGGAGKGIGFAYARTSEWLFMQAFTDKLVSALYPAEFVSIEAMGGPYDLYTDTTPSRGGITAINVVTKSKGGISIAQIFADVVNQFFPYDKALGKITAKAAGLAKTAAGPALKKLPANISKSIKIKLLHPKAMEVKNAISPAREMYEHVAKQLLAQRIGDKQDAGDFKSTTIKPFTFSPVNILERGYHQTNINPTNVVSLEIGETRINYSALSKGRATLRFQSAPNKWGNENIVGEQVISVDADDLIIQPKIVSVIPGDKTGFEIIHKVKAGGEAQKSNLVISFAQPGFSIHTINGPYMQGTEENRWARWVVYVDTPRSIAQYPNLFEVSLRSNIAINDQGRIETGRIAPDRTCIDEGETEHFFYSDHLGRPMPGVEWAVDGPGTITSSGIYTAPTTVNGNADVSIIAKSRQNGDIISQKTYALGCACSWQASLGGQAFSGTKISAANISVGPVSHINFMTLDSAPMMFALTGEGHILAPEYISTAIQDKGISYISGLPVNMNIGKMLGNDSCGTAKTDVHSWSVENGRWLSGHVRGDVTTDAELASGCVTLLKPFDFRFMLDLGENVDITERAMEDMTSGKVTTNSKEFDSLLQAVTKQAGSISACLSD